MEEIHSINSNLFSLPCISNARGSQFHILLVIHTHTRTHARTHIRSAGIPEEESESHPKQTECWFCRVSLE